MEPFEGRTPATVKSDVEYILSAYGSHPALYRHKTSRGDLPMLYIYDSYHNSKEEWRQLLSPQGDISVRGTALDAVYIGLMVESNHLEDLAFGGFDGFYTYFAANGFTFGSTLDNWAGIANKAKKHNLMFIPSVGPGYIDTRVRPWNEKNTRPREDGAVYAARWRFLFVLLRPRIRTQRQTNTIMNSFARAIKCQPEVISVTSFNEWHEGTQIEEAVPKSIDGYTYVNYLPGPPDHYLIETKKHIKEFEASRA